MATALDREIRRLLDNAVRKARVVAEDGARKALTDLGVEDAKRPEGFASAKADLRNRLRAHARSLGDVMQTDGSIKASRLVREIAYEHWHRALFARFLAENDLLIDPDHKVAVSLSDLEQIAREDGRDPVELAADWAEPMLPQIFRKDDPVLALALPPETKAGITEIVKGLPRAVFAADDSLGWVYQFWQADEKDRVNKDVSTSGKKIGADELPAVTQLFTEDYMVLFLLENTLGAWWAGKVLAGDPALAADAGSEDELREKTSPPGYRWAYLRFKREPRDGETHETATGPWRPAAGAFEGWPKTAKEITVLDPCMGSGHFLVFALPILVAFRRAEERLDERAAVKAVLAENLFGLEIDPRCTQIAAFALALASWKHLRGPETLPRLNLACSGLAIGLGKAEFLRLAERIAAKRGWKLTTDLLGDGATPIESVMIEKEREGLLRLYDLFETAPDVGSLIDPSRAGADLFAAGYAQLAGLLSEVLEAGEGSPDIRELTVTAQGLAKAAEVLSQRYVLVATNVPYLGRSRMAAVLKRFTEKHFDASKSDLATCFIQKFACAEKYKSFAAVCPQNWPFQRSYAKLRHELLTRSDVRHISRLGAGAFETITGEVVNVVLFISSSQRASEGDLISFSLPQDGASARDELRCNVIAGVTHESQLSNPDFVINLSDDSRSSRLFQFARCVQGLTTSDDEHWRMQFWEINDHAEWRFLQGPSRSRDLYGGREDIVRRRFIEANPGVGAIRGRDAWNRRGISINRVGEKTISIYSGDLFHSVNPVVVPKDDLLAPAIACFLSSERLKLALSSVGDRLSVDNGYIEKLPFNVGQWKTVAVERFPNGLPKASSNDPTQWLFDGHPRGSADPNVAPGGTTNSPLVTPHGVRPGMTEHPLQVAVARLLGYRWPRQTGSSFMDCPAVTEPDDVDRCGLVDADGIVPLPALAGEADAATRLRELIRAVWGPDYSESTIRELLAAEEARATDLATWLANEFFDGHCKLFHQTPFIWHIWDGVRGGFSALVNYHRLCDGNGAGRRLLEKLRDSYLGEWIAAQRRTLAAGEAGAEERLIAAEHLRRELTKIIEGEPPYDIFVRWKPQHRQPIGWEPDIDDGVRLNIRPFLTAKPKNSGRRDGCILRVTPRVKKHAGADRGAEPYREKENFPWFWAEDDDVTTWDFAGGPAFKGRRYNDFHYTRAFKRRARDAKAKGVSVAERVLEKSGEAP